MPQRTNNGMKSFKCHRQGDVNRSNSKRMQKSVYDHHYMLKNVFNVEFRHFWQSKGHYGYQKEERVERCQTLKRSIMSRDRIFMWFFNQKYVIFMWLKKAKYIGTLLSRYDYYLKGVLWYAYGTSKIKGQGSIRFIKPSTGVPWVQKIWN